MCIRDRSSIGDLRKLGRVGGKTIVYFLATTAIAITLAIIFAIIFNPAGGYILKEVGTYEAKAMPKVADVILKMCIRDRFSSSTSCSP